MAQTPEELAYEKVLALAQREVAKDPTPKRARDAVYKALTATDRKGIINWCIVQAVQQQVWRANAQANHAAKYIDRPVERDGPANGLLARAATRFLDTVSFNGVRLGDMTGADLDAQVRESNAHASGHLRNVRLLTALRKRVGPTDRVRDKWSEAEAVKLNDSVNKAA